MNLQSRCVWRDAVKVVDTFYLPQQTAVESRKQNHYVRAMLKSNKLLLIQCNMVAISLSKHLVCYQYSLWSLKKLFTCICLYIIVTNLSWNIKIVLINVINLKMVKELHVSLLLTDLFGNVINKVSRINNAILRQSW